MKTGSLNIVNMCLPLMAGLILSSLAHACPEARSEHSHQQDTSTSPIPAEVTTQIENHIASNEIAPVNLSLNLARNASGLADVTYSITHSDRDGGHGQFFAGVRATCQDGNGATRQISVFTADAGRGIRTCRHDTSFCARNQQRAPRFDGARGVLIMEVFQRDINGECTTPKELLFFVRRACTQQQESRRSQPVVSPAVARTR